MTRTDLLADLEARARDDAAWLLVVRAYLDGLRAFPGPFVDRHRRRVGLSVEG